MTTTVLPAGTRCGIHGDSTESGRCPSCDAGLEVEAICDFDSDPDVRWRYPADDFEMPGTGWASQGDWAACDPCSDLVEADDWDGLAERCLIGVVKHREAIRVRLMNLHERFAAARTGDRVPHP